MCRLSGTYFQQPLVAAGQAAGRVGQSQALGVTGSRHPQAHAARFEVKHGVLAPVDVLNTRSELSARGKERQERRGGKEGDGRGEKKIPCCFSLMWRLEEKLERDSRFYIHLVNIFRYSD